MLHKRFIFVSLLAPSISFASTATDSLANATTDVFDNLDENPAFVNADAGKTYLRIGKAGGVQAITSVGGFGLGMQINTLSNSLVDPVDNWTTKEISAATASGMPLRLTLGGHSGELKWGAGIQYQNSKRTGGSAGTFTFDPSYLKAGLDVGVIMGKTEASVGFVRDTWKVATSGKTKTNTGAETPNALTAGAMSNQTTDALTLLVNHDMESFEVFVEGGQTRTNSKMWTGTTTTSQTDMVKGQSFEVGVERENNLAESMTLFSKAGLGWSNDTRNGSQQKTESTGIALGSAHGLEVNVASWAAVRVGVKASLYGTSKTTVTNFSEAEQKGTSGANSETSTHILQAVAAPTMGVGFKFGNFAVDASLAQDGSDSMGFSDKILGKVEVTGQF